MDSLEAIQQQCYEDSVNWFGEELVKNLPHMALAMAGEVGELCNVVKKLQRKDFDIRDEAVMQMLANETVDVFIYVVNVANILQLNLGTSYGMKREFNNERFST